MSFGFQHPWVLLLLLGLPAFRVWAGRRRPPALTWSRAGTLAPLAGRGSRWLGALPGWLRALAAAALIVAMAGPRTGTSAMDVQAEGIAIVLTVDVSSSMLAEDFAPDNRLEVARRKVADFVRGRSYDRIGMVAFAGEALTQVPITIDYGVLFRALEELEVGMLEDGTAIGTALATAANRLRRVPGESKVVILMTDGENNRGEIDPLTAAQAADAYGIKVYTIGVGSEGVAPMPIGRTVFGQYQYANVEVHIDEALLRQIADITGGRYFRATNAEALDSIYHQIDRLERTEVEVRRWVDYTPRYLPFLLLGIMLLAAEWTLRASRWGRLP